VDIKSIKKHIRREITAQAAKEERLSRDIIRQMALRILDSVPRDQERLSDAEKSKIIEAVCDDFLGFGPLEKVMGDSNVTEIMVNGPGKVYIEKNGRKTLSDIEFDDEAHLRYIIEKMLATTGRRIDEIFPYVDFSLPDGSRINVIIPPLAVGGATITIRKFLSNIEKVEDLINLETIDKRMADFLVACIKAKVNILFSGATGSGKTTTLEVLSSYIDHQERIISIEDALEIRLRQDHVVRLLTRPSTIEGRGEITLRDLFRNTLRMRPTRIILGEIRGEEAMDYLQALNSGHRGCLSVIHASSPADALSRLETMALYAGLHMSVRIIRQQIASGLNLIIQHEQLPDGKRKITHIAQISGLEDDRILLNDIFLYEIESMDSQGNIKGRFMSTGSLPVFYSLFEKSGVKLPKNLFDKD